MPNTGIIAIDIRTEFMVLGEGPECADGRGAEFGGNLGYSIPAHQIYTRAKNIKWADGTIVCRDRSQFHSR